MVPDSVCSTRLWVLSLLADSCLHGQRVMLERKLIWVSWHAYSIMQGASHIEMFADYMLVVAVVLCTSSNVVHAVLYWQDPKSAHQV